VFGAFGVFINKKLIHSLMITELYILKNKGHSNAIHIADKNCKPGHLDGVSLLNFSFLDKFTSSFKSMLPKKKLNKQ